MSIELRDYQVDAINAVFDAWQAGHRRVAIVVATGGGKTVTFSEILSMYRAEMSDPRPMLVMAHRTELISQAATTIKRLHPELRVGVVQGSQHQVAGRDVIVGSQQTLRMAKRQAKLPAFGLVVVDECHRIASKTYAATVDALGVNRPDGPRMLGVTATFTREDTTSLTDHFDHVAYRLDVLDLIRSGHLVDVRFKRVLVDGLDLTKAHVSKIGGSRDLEPGSLAEVMDKAGAFGVVAEAYARYAADRSGLVFTPTVASAHSVADALTDRGITAEVVHGSMSPGARRATLLRYGRGTTQVVVNCAVLTEGFDAPRTGCVVLARPTYSGTLFRQMVGRALRLYEGKEDALVLDLVGSTGRNELRGPEDLVDEDVSGWSEGESLTAASERVTREVHGRLDEPHEISGSLSAVDITPWAVLEAKGMIKDATEGDDIPAASEDDDPPDKDKPKVVDPVRPDRDGWLLSTPGGNRFLAVSVPDTRTGLMSDAVVFTSPAGHLGHVVVLKAFGTVAKVGQGSTRDDAARIAVAAAIDIAVTAETKSLIDPGARWRRGPVSASQRNFVRNCYPGEDVADRLVRKGDAADMITLHKHAATVDRLAGELNRLANER